MVYVTIQIPQYICGLELKNNKVKRSGFFENWSADSSKISQCQYADRRAQNSTRMGYNNNNNNNCFIAQRDQSNFLYTCM